MEATLHVDLLWTDLEDFVEHFTLELGRTHGNAILGDLSGVWLLWNQEPYPENPWYAGESLDAWMYSSGKYVRNIVSGAGPTGKNFWILEGTKDGFEIPHAIVSVTRYRRDRLNLIVYETQAWGYAERLRQWLDDRWDRAVRPRKTTNIPEPKLKKPMPLLPIRAKKQQWFAWFDWYYDQVWGVISKESEHMASLNSKSISQNESMAALYKQDKRKL